MIEMSGEVLAVIMVISFVVILAAEYLWLYLLSKRNEEQSNHTEQIRKQICNLFEAVLYAAGDSLRKKELETLEDYVRDSTEKADAAASYYIELVDSGSIPDNRKETMASLLEVIDPAKIYGDMLKDGNRYQKCYAMRRLSDFSVEDSMEDIDRYIDSDRVDLSYHSAMALSKMGNADSVMRFMKKCENNKKYSHRVILECLQIFSGNKGELLRQISEECNEYILSSAIKAYMEDGLSECSDIFITAMDSKNMNLKIAATKALAHLGDSEYEQRLTIALHDKNWVVRLAAVSGLELISTDSALESLVSATQDEEWWVRTAAAKAIVNRDFYFTYVERILSGYDKYAADAVKDALYKQVEMKGGMFQ